MSIFCNWKKEAKPHINCREVLFTANFGGSYGRFLDKVAETEDGAKLIALKKHYKERCSELERETSSMRDAMGSIDEALARLVANEAWNRGYAVAEEDMKPIRRPRKPAADKQTAVSCAATM